MTLDGAPQHAIMAGHDVRPGHGSDRALESRGALDVREHERDGRPDRESQGDDSIVWWAVLGSNQ